MKIENDKIQILKASDPGKNLKLGKTKTGRQKDPELKKVSEDLEAVFISQMFKAMEKTIPESSLFGSKNTLSSMMFSNVIGESIAHQRGIGLSEIIYNALVQDNEGINLEQIKELKNTVNTNIGNLKELTGRLNSDG